MSAPTLIRRELLNVALLSFIPVGETVASTTVSATSWPADGTLNANLTSYQIPDVETLELSRTYDHDPIMVPSDAGGYFPDDEPTLKKVEYKGATAKTSIYFKKLELATATIPVVGTALTPFVDNNDYLEGLAVIQFRNKSGTITESIHFWARLRIDGGTKTDPKTRKIGFSLERRIAALNTTTILA